jgi:hypothetical protein
MYVGKGCSVGLVVVLLLLQGRLVDAAGDAETMVNQAFT